MECLDVLAESFDDGNAKVRATAERLSIAVMTLLDGMPSWLPAGVTLAGIEEQLSKRLRDARGRGLDEISAQHVDRFLAGRWRARERLVETFVREECTPDVCELVRRALAEDAPPATKLELNVFEVTIDRTAGTAVIDDVLDATDAGRQVVTLAELEDALPVVG